jgi:hypothetical protein
MLACEWLTILRSISFFRVAPVRASVAPMGDGDL